jgi:hypothetical protein
MMLVGSALKGFAIEASDGHIGTVSDFLFEDRTWNIRWMVADTGDWLTERKILVHPSAIGQPDYRRGKIAFQLTKQQIEDSPDILSDAPVSRQMETNIHRHYGWDPLWGAATSSADISRAWAVHSTRRPTASTLDYSRLIVLTPARMMATSTSGA